MDHYIQSVLSSSDWCPHLVVDSDTNQNYSRQTGSLQYTSYKVQCMMASSLFFLCLQGFYAIVEFEKKESAGRVLADTHVIGGQRLTVKQREMRMFTPRKKAEPADTGGVELTSPKAVDPEELAALLRKSSSVSMIWLALKIGIF